MSACAVTGHTHLVAGHCRHVMMPCSICCLVVCACHSEIATTHHYCPADFFWLLSGGYIYVAPAWMPVELALKSPGRLTVHCLLQLGCNGEEWRRIQETTECFVTSPVSNLDYARALPGHRRSNHSRARQCMSTPYPPKSFPLAGASKTLFAGKKLLQASNSLRRKVFPSVVSRAGQARNKLIAQVT